MATPRCNSTNNGCCPRCTKRRGHDGDHVASTHYGMRAWPQSQRSLNIAKRVKLETALQASREMDGDDDGD